METIILVFPLLGILDEIYGEVDGAVEDDEEVGELGDQLNNPVVFHLNHTNP